LGSNSTQAGRVDASPAWVIVLLSVSVPLLSHLAALLDSRWLRAICLVVLVSVPLAARLQRGEARAWGIWAAAALACMALALGGAANVLLLILPVAVNILLAWAFGRTLLAGRTPLIERFATLIREPDQPLNDAVRLYARRLTLTWTLFLWALALWNLFLAAVMRPAGLLSSAGIEIGVQVSPRTWSEFANLYDYVLIAVFMAAEFAWRLRRFPEYHLRSPAAYARRLARAGWQLRAGVQQPRQLPAVADTARFTATIAIAANHPALAGHFPGRPVVPGVLLLDEVLQAVERWLGPVSCSELVQAKFVRPLLPDESAQLTLRRRDAGVEFELRRQLDLIASGSLRTTSRAT
jgi:uncharacterized membrane protein